MFGLEKSLNEITLVSTLATMVCAFLYKKGVVGLRTVIFMCILTLLLYLCSRTVINNGSKLNNKDKVTLDKIKEDVQEKKGKK